MEEIVFYFVLCFFSVVCIGSFLSRVMICRKTRSRKKFEQQESLARADLLLYSAVIYSMMFGQRVFMPIGYMLVVFSGVLYFQYAASVGATTAKTHVKRKPHQKKTRSV